MTTRNPGRLIAQLVEHYDELLAMLSRRLGNAEAAADVAQDVAVKLMAVQAGKQDVWQPKHYIFRVARNMAVDRQRYDALRERRRLPLDASADVEDEAAATPEQLLADRERLQQVMAVIEDLPPRCRQVFVMRRLQDMDQAAIAQVLGISRNMVEKHLRVAMMYILQRMGRLE